MSATFSAKKARILKQLEVPGDEYSDLSPKGSIDEGIRQLINEINAISTLATTSSCAGRVSVYLEGRKKSQEDESDGGGIAGPGGKGGGQWLYVNHDPVPLSALHGSENSIYGLLGLQPFDFGSKTTFSPAAQYIHFKFEAMILHILTASLDDASKLLAAASSSGFRESGAMGFNVGKDGSTTPMVAIRCNGLALDSVVGYLNENGNPTSIVSGEHLRMLVDIANERFKVNTERIARFRDALLAGYLNANDNSLMTQSGDWEDAEARKARKRAEGLAKQEEVRNQKASLKAIEIDDLDIPIN